MMRNLLMCNGFAMNSVRRRMLLRRQFFSASAVTFAAVTTGGVAPPALAQGHSGVVDMTLVYDEASPTNFGAPWIAREQPFTFAEHGVNLLSLSLNEHTGTHIDAPQHL